AEMPRGGVPYKYFYVETNFTEDRWVERAEAKPGASEVVHHIIAFVVPPGLRFMPGDPRTPALSGTAPGDMPMILPPGMGTLVPTQARLVVHIHYPPNGKAQTARSSIAPIFCKQPPKSRVHTEPVGNVVFRIPPGADNHRVEAWYPLTQDGRVISFMPHMHL